MKNVLINDKIYHKGLKYGKGQCKMKIRKFTTCKPNIRVKIKADKSTKIKNCNKKPKGEINMATQIAPTPTLYGEEAMKVLKEIKIMPSEKAKENAKRLLEYFNNFNSKRD